MKVLLLLGLVAFSIALPTYTGRWLTLKEDGTIVLKSGNGHELDIFNSLTKPRTLNVVVKTPGAVPKTLEVEEGSDGKQLDALRDILKRYEGILDDSSYYRLLYEVEFLVKVGVLDQTLLDVLRDWDLKLRSHQVSDVATKQEFARIQGLQPETEELDVQGEKTIYQEFWSPRIEQLQDLLKYIKLQRQFQQGKVNSDYDFPQQTTAFRKYWLRESPQNHQQFLEQYGNEAFEQDSFDQNLQQWTVQQQWLNQQVEQLHPTVPVPEELIQEITERQALLNRKAEKGIGELINQQTVITYQIEGLLQQKQFASSDLVNRQRIVYKHIQQALERLVYQKSFIDKKILQMVQQGFSVHQQLYIQHHILSQQIYRLIQQIFFQHIHIKQQIKFFYQHEDVLPQEWIAIEKLTYQQVETFIPALIQLLTYQQEYVRYYFALIDRKGEVIPEVTVERYLNFYKKLLELTVEGDLVPEELYFKQKEIHQQIVQLVRENQEKKVTNRVVYWPQEELELSQQQPWKFFPQKQQEREYQPKQQWNPFQQSWNLLPQQKHEQELRTVLPVDNIYQRYQTVY